LRDEILSISGSRDCKVRLSYRDARSGWEQEAAPRHSDSKPATYEGWNLTIASGSPVILAQFGNNDFQ
jgi:hypothetical protein